MFGLRHKTRPLLGIDISSTAVKLIELSRSSGSGELYRVDAFAIEALPQNAVVEKKIVDVQVVGQSIQRAAARSGSKAKRAAVAVAGAAVITKIIPMSATLSESEMEAQIRLEADQYIPYPLEEVNLDFDVVGPSRSGSDMVDVLIAATRRENVDDRVAALEIAGLTAEVVDVEAYAMEGACALLLGGAEHEQRDQTISVADIGATTTLHVMHNGRSVYTREQNFGGNQLLEEIQQRYGLSRAEALERLEGDTLPDNFDSEVLIPYKEALAQQIARALQFFYSSSSFNRTDQVVLAGGSATIPRIDDLVEQRLGFPVSIANPFTSMSVASGVDRMQLDQAAPSMMVAAGLALRAFD
ncbi:MAG: pilus assembly protein PilM [Thiohalocapsa sp.]|nr:pilus assembly protein PilM [Thiohalocapsa sp.]MCF7988901.1 pilus assembly protein PilM [Thiohalocapsa sp.]